MRRELAEEMIAHLPRLRRFAQALTRDRSDADDLAQAACERALRNLDRFQPGTRLDSWLFRIAQNLHLNERRGTATRARHLRAVEDEAPKATAASGEAQAELAQVRAFIDGLPPEQRVVLLLIAVEGYGYAEAARILDVPEGTVTSRLARARRALKEWRDG